jgi:hypothetical protein
VSELAGKHRHLSPVVSIVRDEVTDESRNIRTEALDPAIRL